MTNPIAPDLAAVVAAQQDAIERLTATAESHQQQIEALWRRIQDLEGIPFPDEEAPG